MGGGNTINNNNRNEGLNIAVVGAGPCKYGIIELS